MRRLVIALALVLAAPAAAATVQRIHGTRGNDFIQAAWGGKQRVDCGRGFDVVAADLGDDVAADCEVVSRRLSVDPSTNVAGQHETSVEPAGAAWGSTVVAAYQVGRFATGGASYIGFAVSSDAGRTWTRGLLPGITGESTPPGPERAASDPSVAYDAVHSAWLISTLTIEPGGSRVMVAHSSDGLHWSMPVTAASGPALDKDWITCDNGTSSRYRGRCYDLYTDDDKNITVSQSSDDGGVTWSQPVTTGRVLVGTQPVVLADGTLVVVAGDYHGELAQTGTIEGFRSTDGGVTFAPITVSAFDSAKPGVMRAIPLPSLQADGAGTLYVAWDDCRFRPGCTANDIVLSISNDEGATWSTPTRVTRTAGTAIIPGLAADPARPGGLAVVFAYFTPSGALGIALVQSQDGGATWTPPQQLAAQPMEMQWLADAQGGRMVGDYFSAEFAGGRVVPVYALAAPKLGTRFREAIFTTSAKALG